MFSHSGFSFKKHILLLSYNLVLKTKEKCTVLCIDYLGFQYD